MTLKEKLFDVVFDNVYELKKENVVPECEQIADDFAIEFAEWKDNNCFKATGIMLWYINMDEEVHGVYNNKQLLEIYKKMYEGT